MTYYLKYRPQTIDDLDIPEAREALKKIVESGNIPHAFLFSGPKGIGKTSAARILAKIINCERPKESNSCNECSQCTSIMKGNNLDVIELDAASHRGIDDVRTLRDAVKLAPTKSKKKIYIIDEAHMLTTEASNALLKTLEEPPEHVVFILATTNPEKLIETIRSRTVNIAFRKAKPEELVRSLTRIAKGEKINIKKEGLVEITKAAGGSFRDAAKTLEQLVSQKVSLDKDSIKEFLFRGKLFDSQTFLELFAQKDAKKLIEEIENINNKGVAMDNLLDNLIENFRSMLLAKVGIGNEESLGKEFEKGELTDLIELLSDAKVGLSTTSIEQLPLELAVINWCGDVKTKNGVGNGDEKETPKVKKTQLENVETKIDKNDLERKQQMIEEKRNKEDGIVKKESSSPMGTPGDITEEVWKNILVRIKPINSSIEALLRAASPINFDGGNLTLGVYYRFHKERLEENKNRKIFEGVVKAVLGKPIRLNCILTDPPSRKIIPEEAPLVNQEKTSLVLTEGKDKDIIRVAEEIFGN